MFHYWQLNAKGNIAKAIKTKANLEEKGSEAQEKVSNDKPA